MKPVVLRFAITAGVFAAWIGYLFYLWLHLPSSPHGLPAILSRPQFLVSDLDVIGVIEDADTTLPLSQLLDPEAAAGRKGGGVASAVVLGGERTVTVRMVKIEKVLYPADGFAKRERIAVTNFKDCRSPRPGPPSTDEHRVILDPLPEPLNELGPCLLPLRSPNEGLTWEVVPLPPSPGYSLSPPRIYPDNSDTQAQYRQIKKLKR